jgi:hypothetical protein
MNTGFNSNVERDGQVYHVQTEDMGVGHAVVETRVYSGGQVVAAVEHSYADLADSPDYSQDRILQRMREQHQSLIRGLETGSVEDLELRLRTQVANPDAEHLVQEYVEDWIDSSAWTTNVLQTLERDVEAGQVGSPKRAAKKKRFSARRRSV